MLVWGTHEQMWLRHFAHTPAGGGRPGRPGGALQAAAWTRLGSAAHELVVVWQAVHRYAIQYAGGSAG